MSAMHRGGHEHVPRTSTPARTTWRQQGNLAAATGLLFVALFGGAFLVTNVIADGGQPSPFVSSDEITRFFIENRSEVQVASFFHALAALALVVFASYVAAFVRRSMDDTGALPWLALGGGLLSATFLMLTALGEWTLSRRVTADDVVLVRTLQDMVYAAGGPAHVMAFAPFLGASSIAALTTRTLPNWVAWLGIAAAIPSLLSGVTLLWDLAAWILPLSRVLTFAWISIVSLLLLRGWPADVEERRSDRLPTSAKPA